MNGHVRTEELNTNKLEAGVICVLKNDENTLRICTIQHIDQFDHWVVTGKDFDDYTVPLTAQLCRLVIVATRGTYPLKFNQWANAIKSNEVDDNRPVQFELIPQKFKYGKYIRVCQACTAQFMGGRSQPACETCCTKNVTAQITVTKKLIKSKRPRLMQPEQSKELALNAFKHGKDGMSNVEFVKWLEKQF